jgi:hypothetical protein
MTHLAGESNQLPANIWLKSVDYHREPFAESALGAVYRGSWNKLDVVLKIQRSQNSALVDKVLVNYPPRVDVLNSTFWNFQEILQRRAVVASTKAR